MKDIFSTLSLAGSVLTDARVIGTAIAVFLVMDFAVFVANAINLLIILLVLIIQFTISKVTGASIDRGVGGN